MPKMSQCRFKPAVYGVAIEGYEGKFGCAALVIDPKAFKIEDFYSYAIKQLPTYAMPLFVRIVDTIDMTGTNKMSKTKLINAGVDPSSIGTENVYFRNDKLKQYIPFTGEIWANIVAKRIQI